MPPRKSLAKVVASGDHRQSLSELRQVLAGAIDAGPVPRDLAALSRRLMSVMAELAALPQAEKESPVDDIAARRQKRRTAS